MPADVTAAHLATARQIIRERIGVSVPDSRDRQLQRALEGGLSALGPAGTVDVLLSRLRTSPLTDAAVNAIVEGVTINETHFFRNRPQFEALRNHVLPQLIEKRRATRRLRIWSAACSSGEEIYSMAILLDHLLPDRSAWDLHLIGTDIDRNILAKATRGRYGSWSFREVPAEFKDKYFRSVTPDVTELSPEIRQMVQFEPLNLVEDRWPASNQRLSRMDLILCRNVLIYFAPDDVQSVVDRLHSSLSPDGWLVVGHAEPDQHVFRRFETRNYPGTILYHKPHASEHAVAAPPAALPAMKAASRSSQSPTLSAPAKPQTKAASASPFEEGMKLLASGAENRGLALLEQAAGQDKRDCRPVIELARRHARRLRYAEAERWIREAIRRAPLSVSAQHLAGIVLQETGKHDEALSALRRSVFLDANFAMGHYTLAGVLHRMGQNSMARRHLHTAISLLEAAQSGTNVLEGEGLTASQLLALARSRLTLIEQQSASAGNSARS